MNKLLRSLLLFGVLLLSAWQSQAQTNPLIKHIQDLQATVENRRSFLTKLGPGDNYLLPIGLLKTGDGNKPAVLIDEINLYKDYAEMKAYVSLQLPGSSNPLYFATIEPVKIGYNGGILGTARMELVEDRKVKIMSDDTYFVVKKGNGSGNSGSFIEFDCNGFSRASLDVEALLSSKLVKENSDGSQNLGTTDADRVKGRFRAEFADLNDIIATMSIEPFQVKGSKGFTFEVQEAVLDMSDLSNAASVNFPAGYIEDYYTGVSPNLWRGFYLKRVSVKLPTELKDRSAPGRKEIAVNDLLIDNHGFSGTAEALNLITLENGDMDGWSYSVDRIAVTLRANQFVGGGLGGGLVLPIGKDDTPLSYDAVFDKDLNFGFTVTTDRTIEVPIFAATMQIYPGSSVDVTVIERKFKAGATLSGSLTVGASLTEDASDKSTENGFHCSGLAFQDLRISTTSPYVHSGTFTMSSVGATVAGFSLGFENINLVKTNDNVGLKFRMLIGMGNPEDGNNNFSAQGDLSILGRVEVGSDSRHRYLYTKTQLDRAYLNINHGSFSLTGELDFFRNVEVFGSGFKGSLQVKLPMKINVAATALFGKVNGFRYWYTDALVAFGSNDPNNPFGGGIKVTPAFEIRGFSGGLYYRIKQKPASFVPAFAVVNSQTGLAYLPDPNAGLGIRAGVMFNLIPNAKTLNGNVGFEVSFNSGGGLNRVALMGNVNVMQDPSPDVSMDTKRASDAMASTEPESSIEGIYDQMSPPGPFSAKGIIEYVSSDPVAGTGGFLSARVDARLSLVGGAITGNFWADAYFSSSTWHVLFGTPTNRNQVSALGLATLSSYFMVGKNLPETTPVPAIVAQSIGLYKGISKNTSSLGRGDGVAFGAALSVDTGDLSFLIFYGRFQAGVGFDVALKNYGPVQCAGRSGTLGINGWYASGSAYAYVSGSVGIRVKVFGKRRSLPILSISAGALMQAKLPNPNWFQGAVGGSYKILGGLVKGKCKFQVTIGSQCEVVGTPLEAETDIKIISEIIPSDGEQDIPTTSDIKVLFDAPLYSRITGQDLDGQDVSFYVDLFKLSVKADDVEVEGSRTWNSEGTEVKFTPTQLLPANKNITVTVDVTFEYQQGYIHVEGDDGLYYPVPNWVTYRKDNGDPYIERVTSTFKTSERPVKLNKANIVYSYPLIDQINYYKGETKSGYIAINQRQDYLLDPNSNIQPVAFIVDPDNNEASVPLTLNQADRRFEFEFPDLATNTGYHLILRSATTQRFAEGDDVEEATDQSEIFTLNFRTSKYETLQEKLNAAGKTHIPGEIGGVTLTLDEKFEDVEMFGYSNKLIEATPDLSFVKQAQTLNVFNDYPLVPDAQFWLQVVDGVPQLTHWWTNYTKGSISSWSGGEDYVNIVPGDGSVVSLTTNHSVKRNFEAIIESYKYYFYRNAGQDPALYESIPSHEGVHPDRIVPNFDFPNGYPYYGYGDRAHLNYWNYDDHPGTYFDENRANYPGYNTPEYYDVESGQYIWSVYVDGLTQFRETTYPSLTRYPTWPDLELRVKLLQMAALMDKKYEQSDLSTLRCRRFIVKYVLPGTSIVTSTNIIDF